MTLKDLAVKALDASLDASAKNIGIKTDKVRAILAAYCDGAVRLKASTVRSCANYLLMVSR